MSLTEAITLGAVVTSAGAAAIVDIRTRRIPNGLTAGAATLGLLLGVGGLSGTSAASSLMGLLLGTFLLLPGYLLGGTGAGDVKLLASQGAILGVSRIVPAFLFGAIAGGFIALAIAAARGDLKRTLAGSAALVGMPVTGRQQALARQGNRFPYGPAIAIGCIAAALGGA